MAGLAGMAAGFISLRYLPLPEQMTIGYASPLIVVALAALFLGETVRIYRWSAVVVGFLGGLRGEVLGSELACRSLARLAGLGEEIALEAPAQVLHAAQVAGGLQPLGRGQQAGGPQVARQPRAAQ